MLYGTRGVAAEEGAVPHGGAVPVLVELFTSEGCSSCPPADAALLTLATEQAVPGAEVIPLEEHVDYWNRLGWTDPFSSRAFSARQDAYGEVSGFRQIYTPQMIVDGRTELVGSDLTRARQAVGDATRSFKTSIRIMGTRNTLSGDILNVRIESAPFDGGAEEPELWAAITEDGLSTDAFGGENRGRRLRHGAVVRVLQMVGRLGASGGTAEARFRIGKDWSRERLRVVAFVQDRTTRRVLGAGATPFSAL
jgi:hypothetical protein